MSSSLTVDIRAHLLVGALIQSDAVDLALQKILVPPRFTLSCYQHPEQFLEFLDKHHSRIDCLILQDSPNLAHLTASLRDRSVLLPAVIVHDATSHDATSHDATIKDDPPVPQGDPSTHQEGSPTRKSAAPETQSATQSDPAVYHPAEVWLNGDRILDQGIPEIEVALTRFLQLPISPVAAPAPKTSTDLENHPGTLERPLTEQQHRLADKLKARLGYLGVYYKRDAKNFLRHLPQSEQHKLLDSLKQEYREIVLVYFSQDESVNQKIDDFVNTAFFADIAVAQIVEIHMELMDAFAKQLRLEGRSDEILLDYRLTLIDTIAHLCEMYRRSIPREP